MIPTIAMLVLSALARSPQQPPRDAVAVRAEADRLYNAGDFRAAAEAYRRVLELSPYRAHDSAAPERTDENLSNIVGPGNGVVEPRVNRLAEALSTRQGGTVRILALVSEAGALLEIKVLKSSGDGRVDEAATTALKASQIEGPTKDGKPVKMWKTFTLTVTAA